MGVTVERSDTAKRHGVRVVDCGGAPRASGRAHGEQARDLIRLGLERWLDALGRRRGANPDEYLADFLAATDYLPAVRRWTPGLLEEIEGIAEGAGQPFARLFAYNLLDEEWGYARYRRGAAPGCTVACLRRGERGAPVLAQTMDIPALHDGTQVVLRLVPDDGPPLALLSYAGMIGLTGCNAAGIGVVLNNIDDLVDSPTGLPVAFVLRGILSRATRADAAEFVREAPHATGQHYAVGGPDGVRAFEAWGRGVAEVPANGERYLHTNHPLLADDFRGDPEAAFASSTTRERLRFAETNVSPAAGQAGLETLLADTTTPVSFESADGGMTFGAVSMELTAPPRFRVAPGPPHLTAWHDVAVPTAGARSAV